ncbi:hypothetical protein G5C51_27430 [Streptomyces sp. A7024]|uniref:Uncharacterized protein n=1 Tax=Streptomyces coryli TaxID=1128680 RepID=A0A6G4U6K1_9ACTN|nr:hypothetical protein [Streptomyces coryli]NGN67622.1 hypothetical protein [Streptomyces coryli]
MVSRHPSAEHPAPFLELHWGGLHVVVEHVPYRLLTVIGGAVSALGAVMWFGG